ncbi:MAG: hemerythrin domain-containing protein [Porticoccaceae bacterium]|jgi:hemerythrin-like domain-containing protein|nr:hemerythrin domain-containing protein [Porticoccaceae bacterium]
MPSISNFMTDNHRHCDNIFATAEQAVSQENWEEAAKATKAFIDEMELHFVMEEKVLFPSLEEKTGMTMGPTQVMRMEHEQMRNLFQQMRQALEAQAKDEFLGASETLLITMQQHNMKEEGILYPMSDEQLADNCSDILEKMKHAS